MLGLVVERVAGVSFPDYCREHIFAPLAMERTVWLVADLDPDLAAVPYRHGRERLVHYSFPTYPDGSLRTSVREYVRFLMAMAAEGRLGDRAILQPQTVRLMLGPQAREGRQGLAWRRSPLADLMLPTSDPGTVGHTGGDPGCLSVVLLHPGKRAGRVFFMNSDPRLDLRALNLYLLLRRLVREAGL